MTLPQGGEWVLSQITFTEILKTVFGPTPKKNPGYAPGYTSCENKFRDNPVYFKQDEWEKDGILTTLSNTKPQGKGTTNLQLQYLRVSKYNHSK